MSPLPPSTSPSVSALGLSNYLQVKEVNETQPQVKEVSTFQQQRQAELDDWWKYRKDHEPAPSWIKELFQPGRTSSSVNEVNSFQQERQAELDDWWKYRKAHEVPFKTLTQLLDVDGTPHQSTEDCTQSPPYSPLGSPTPSLEVMLSSVVPTVRPSLDSYMSPKSSTSSPFSLTVSPQSVEESVLMELMLDVIYHAKNAKKKGMVTRTLSLHGEDYGFSYGEDLEIMGSLSGSNKTNASRTEKLGATVKEMFCKMPAFFAPRKRVKSSQSKSSSANRSLVSHLSKRLRGALKQE